MPSTPTPAETLRAAAEVLADTERYLSALHGAVARHDNLGADLTCAGCQVRDRISPTLAVARQLLGEGETVREDDSELTAEEARELSSDLAAALAAGYGLGRWRPWTRLGNWVNWELRFHLDRWNGTRPRQALLFVLLLATDPVGTVHTWRHRNDPPPPPAPPVRIRDMRAEPEETK